MSISWDTLDPTVDITLEDGTTRRYLLELDQEGGAVEIAESPDEGFPPPITIGPPEQNSDVRTRKVIWRDWRRGMGRDEYDETAGLSDFRDSQCDTRFPNILVCRPLMTRLGSSTTVAVGSLVKLVPVNGAGNAAWFAYLASGTSSYYNIPTSQWVSTGLVNGSDFYVRGQGGMFYIYNGNLALAQSDDAVTWNTVALTGIGTSIYGIAIHDNKLFTLGGVTAITYNLYQSTNAVTTPATATWTQLGTLILGTNEVVNQLFVWRNPTDPGRPAIFCLTNRRIYWYDDTADAASVTAWKRWHEWSRPYVGFGYGHAAIHAATGDLYVMPHATQDRIYQFTGSTIARHGPNKAGGLPPSRQHAIAWTQSSGDGLYCWLIPNAPYVGAAGSTGMVAHFNDQEGWHHLFDAVNTAIIGAGKSIVGGGLGFSTIATVLNDGTVWSQDLYETSNLPQYATTARTYDIGANYHVTAKTDVGTPTLLKAALYVEVNVKIPTGATVGVAYRLDDFDGTGVFTSLGAPDATVTQPARIAFPANIRFRQIELQLTLTRGTATSATPIVYSLILHTTLIVPIRWVYQLRVDVRRASYRNVPPTFNRSNITAARTWIRALHGKIAAFTVAHPAADIAVSRAQVTVSPIEGPRGEGGRYLLQFRSLETPVSGS